MRITPFLLIFTAASLLAFTVPPFPRGFIVGRVLSTEKVCDVGGDKVIHSEMWKAEINVLNGGITNLPRHVTIFYPQDWSTNYVEGNRVIVGLPPRQRLSTNQIYKFLCWDLFDGDQKLFHLTNSDGTNAFRAYDNNITKSD